MDFYLLECFDILNKNYDINTVFDILNCVDLSCYLFYYYIYKKVYHPKTGTIKIHTLQKVGVLDLKPHNISPAQCSSFTVHCIINNKYL